MSQRSTPSSLIDRSLVWTKFSPSAVVSPHTLLCTFLCGWEMCVKPMALAGGFTCWVHRIALSGGSREMVLWISRSYGISSILLNPQSALHVNYSSVLSFFLFLPPTLSSGCVKLYIQNKDDWFSSSIVMLMYYISTIVLIKRLA